MKHTIPRVGLGLGLAILGLMAGMAGSVEAGLTLTPAGVAQGLSLSTFASGFPTLGPFGGVGPLGIAFQDSGGVLVTDYPGNIRRFPTDTDGQNAASAPVIQNYGGTNANDFAQIGSSIYMTRQGVGDLIQLNNNGTFNQVIASGLPLASGLIADPANGHLFVSTLGNSVIYDVDPIAKSKSSFLSLDADGLSISPDGSILYTAARVNGHILGFNTTSKALVFDSGPIPGRIDGTAVGTGLFSGFIFANTNSGQLFEVNLSTLAQTLIASGGSRGDYVTVDPSTNTLLITQTDLIVRLNGASFTNPVPEPSTIALIASAVPLGLGHWLRRKRAAA